MKSLPDVQKLTRNKRRPTREQRQTVTTKEMSPKTKLRNCREVFCEVPNFKKGIFAMKSLAKIQRVLVLFFILSTSGFLVKDSNLRLIKVDQG